MLVLKANYDNGVITLIEPMPENIKTAKLTVVVENIDNDEKLVIPGIEFNSTAKESETEYKLIGLHSFFNSEDDKNINWEDYFGLKN